MDAEETAADLGGLGVGTAASSAVSLPEDPSLDDLLLDPPVDTNTEKPEVRTAASSAVSAWLIPGMDDTDLKKASSAWTSGSTSRTMPTVGPPQRNWRSGSRRRWGSMLSLPKSSKSWKTSWSLTARQRWPAVVRWCGLEEDPINTLTGLELSAGGPEMVRCQEGREGADSLHLGHGADARVRADPHREEEDAKDAGADPDPLQDPHPDGAGPSGECGE